MKRYGKRKILALVMALCLLTTGFVFAEEPATVVSPDANAPVAMVETAAEQQSEAEQEPAAEQQPETEQQPEGEQQPETEQ